MPSTLYKEADATRGPVAPRSKGGQLQRRAFTMGKLASTPFSSTSSTPALNKGASAKFDCTHTRRNSMQNELR